MSETNEHSAAPRGYADDPEWCHDIAYAMNIAIEFLENEEFGGDEPERQRAAYLEVAKRIKRMLRRHEKSNC